MSVSVGAGDRLTFTIFLAAAVHAMLVFGISFNLGSSTKPDPSLDVTLVYHTSDVEPEKADFLAQSNQQGSGTEDEAKLLQTTETSEFEDNSIQNVNTEQQNLLIKQQHESQARIITTTAGSQKIEESQQQADEQPEANSDVDQIVLQQTQDIATLKAALSDMRQRYANRPRIRTLSALSTKQAEDAAYLYEWLQKIERIGNLNYPDEARQRKMTGDVRMLVSLLPNGTVKRIEILGSSGHQLLDDAAKRIVRLASPFKPFPDSIKENTDELEIIRTWRFRTKLELGN
ncbi:energy transducer TonB [Gynuella sunshinyii]|uniref:Periplasmic protein TonB, links inner and outer membrane n=1 Tax=Gynuella sunshinyii YC6258 TaxID=1445510 RepID=A0A0C5VGX0_9GAMM|nr:energy transducer TonB [Gynuella sunshinyii]AJQ93471.1 periplasmic protein TonB, links inner and outer membrane [Gynuella sunshinyii YC6258]